MKSKKLLLPILVLSLVGASALLIWQFQQSQKIESGGPKISTTLSEGSKISYSIELEDVAGKKINLESLKGKVLLINFWASWCAPCVREMPGLFKMQNNWKEKNFLVLGISMDDDPVQAIESLKRITGAAPFEMYRGQDSAISSLFPIEGLPYSVIIDKEGTVQYAQAGEVDWTSKDATKWIERFL